MIKNILLFPFFIVGIIVLSIFLIFRFIISLLGLFFVLTIAYFNNDI